jgi:pimeloyl-ACP methyl ester carboxylesterase
MSTINEIELHGHRVCFRLEGEGPVVVLIHGITGRSDQWVPAIEHLAAEHTVLAPDLLGHGESAKPRGGHSLGGGIAMQFAYQFPERIERLVLVNSGGLGRDVHPMLRASTLPGSELVLPLLTHATLLAGGESIGRALGRIGLQAGTDMAEIARGFASLGDAEARHAFIQTMRAVLDPGGQRVSALDRLYLTEDLPSLLVWGTNDPIIPVEHGREAHELMPGSRLELLDGLGHFPQLEDPHGFAKLLADFIAETDAAELDTATIREKLLVRVVEAAGV